MVQVIDIQAPQRRPGIAELLGSGLGQGLGQGIGQAGSMLLQTKLGQMFEDKKIQRNKEINKSALGDEYGGMDPSQAVKLHQLRLEYGQAGNLQNAFN